MINGSLIHKLLKTRGKSIKGYCKLSFTSLTLIILFSVSFRLAMGQNDKVRVFLAEKLAIDSLWIKGWDFSHRIHLASKCWMFLQVWMKMKMQSFLSLQDISSWCTATYIWYQYKFWILKNIVHSAYFSRQLNSIMLF